MARGFSKVILMGNLTRDPETRTTPNGQNVTSFTIAVGRTWKGADGQMQDQTSFINCVAWGRTGETIAQYMNKGSAILVSGRLDQRSWEDKESGQKRSAVEVNVEDFTFVGGRGDDQGSSNASAARPKSGNKPKDTAPEDVDDAPIDLSEIPF